MHTMPAYHILPDQTASALLRVHQRGDGLALQYLSLGESHEVVLSPAQLQALLRVLPRQALWEALGAPVHAAFPCGGIICGARAALSTGNDADVTCVACREALDLPPQPEEGG